MIFLSLAEKLIISSSSIIQLLSISFHTLHLLDSSFAIMRHELAAPPIEVIF